MDTEPCGYGIPPDILQEDDMKCIAIQVGDITGEKTTLEQFAERAEAKSSLGRLFIALTLETAWSNDYTIGAYLSEVSRQQPSLVVSHKAFIRPLTIKDGVGTDLSLRGAERAVRAHFNECRKWMSPIIEHLNGQMNDMRQASEDIAVDKARVAIVAAFSEEVDISQTPITAGRDLYAFHKKDIDRGPIYVARKLDHEFVGGVARIDCSASCW
ncbi:MAG: hypothetical protein Q8L30_00180, partial [bacterium]|nr:hypothetical protein [bacterium]